MMPRMLPDCFDDGLLLTNDPQPTVKVMTIVIVEAM